jgi:ribosome recycling factor
MASVNDVISEAKDKMDKAYQHLNSEFAGLRTGKASAGMVDHLNISYYGSNVSLREIASVSTPEPRLIVINPFDPSSLKDIEKAVMSANLGITPMNDGRIIRLPIPELSDERRKEIIKIAKDMTEKDRISIRNIRHDANEKIKKMEKNSEIGEDEKELMLEEVQKLTDENIGKMDELLKNKQEELSAV